jgi:hypothetical protein
MESLMLFLFASAGATFIVTYSTIFKWLRDIVMITDQREDEIEDGNSKANFKERCIMFYRQLIHCPLCFGFWMSSVMYLFLFGIEDYNFLVHFAHACAGSAASMLFYRFINK